VQIPQDQSKPTSHGRSMLAVFGLLLICGIAFYLFYAGKTIGSDEAVKAALIQLRNAQLKFRRLDHNGDGYLEFTLRLHDLNTVSNGSSPLIAPALIATCDDDAVDNLFGYRFHALKGITLDGHKITFTTSPGGSGTLDGFVIAALPVDTSLHGHTAWFIRENGEPWSVVLSDDREKILLQDFAPEGR